MKTIQITEGAHLVNGIHRTREHPPFDVPDKTADDLVRMGHATVVGATNLVHRGFVGGKDFADAMAEAYTPPLPSDDPTHAARLLASPVEEYPGLVALADAGHSHAKAKGRYGVPKAGEVEVPANASGDTASPDAASKPPAINPPNGAK